MPTRIITKYSSTPGAEPTAGDLSVGELAVNVADHRLFTKDGNGDVQELTIEGSAVYKTGPYGSAILPPGTTAQRDGSPVNGYLRFNTDTSSLEVYDGSWGEVVLRTATTGSVKLPSGTQAQRDGSPAAGYIRFNSDITKFEGYNGTVWSSVGGGATGGGSDAVFIENDQTVTTNYTIPASKNAMSTGPVTVNSGVTVTVSSGARYIVI